ncbi:MAG: hypothetical protein ACFFB3_20520 [Candidatus Hodarchaeota archaeon]
MKKKDSQLLELENQAANRDAQIAEIRRKILGLEEQERQLSRLGE